MVFRCPMVEGKLDVGYRLYGGGECDLNSGSLQARARQQTQAHRGVKKKLVSTTVVCPTGSGKTTPSKLYSGVFYPCYAGEGFLEPRGYCCNNNKKRVTWPCLGVVYRCGNVSTALVNSAGSGGSHAWYDSRCICGMFLVYTSEAIPSRAVHNIKT